LAVKTASEMTYTVSSGALNSTTSTHVAGGGGRADVRDVWRECAVTERGADGGGKGGRRTDGRARVRAARRVDRKILTPRPARHGRRRGTVWRCRGPPPRSPPPAPPISSSRRQWRMHTATFHYSGPTGPARTFLRPGYPRNPVGSVRSVRVRAGPVGSGRVRVVEFSLYQPLDLQTLADLGFFRRGEVTLGTRESDASEH